MTSECLFDERSLMIPAGMLI